MKILITGANGFIGKALTKKQLEYGNEVYALVTSANDMIDIHSNKLHILELDFKCYHTISSIINENIDIAFHLAWAGLSGLQAKDVELQLQNVSATFELLKQLKMLGLKKFIFASTMNTIEVRNMLSNPTKYKTRGVYIHVSAKINAEIVARTFCEENHIVYNEAVLAMAYGENNKSKMITNVFIYSILNDIEPKLVQGNNKYDLIYISDITSALQAISLKGIDKKSYYVGHNWQKTFKEIFTEIKDVINPNFKLSFGTLPDDNQIDFSIVDRTELTIDTGWVPNTDFKQSIINTSTWIKESGIKFI